MACGTGHDDVEYYGGHLIAESIQHKEDIELIAAAPELLKGLKAIVDHCRSEDESMFQSDLITDAIAAIAKAEGGGE